jgi:hypothetical protein
MHSYLSHFRKSYLNHARNCRGLTRKYLQIVESKISHSLISWISWFIMFSFYGLLESIICESELQTPTRRRNNIWNCLLECASLRQIEFRIRLNSFIHSFIDQWSMINGNLCRSRNPFNSVSQLLWVLSTCTLHFTLYIQWATFVLLVFHTYWFSLVERSWIFDMLSRFALINYTREYELARSTVRSKQDQRYKDIKI